MANFSDYMENLIIDHMLRAQAWTPPATIYLALFTAVTGLEANAPTSEVPTAGGTGYVRKVLALNAGTAGVTANTVDLDWGTAGANYGTVTHVAIVDHPTNVDWGVNVNVLMWGQLTTPKTVDAGDIFKILAGALDITML